jgi:hypothetical protein
MKFKDQLGDKRYDVLVFFLGVMHIKDIFKI